MQPVDRPCGAPSLMPSCDLSSRSDGSCRGQQLSFREIPVPNPENEGIPQEAYAMRRCPDGERPNRLLLFGPSLLLVSAVALVAAHYIRATESTVGRTAIAVIAAAIAVILGGLVFGFMLILLPCES